MERPDYHDAVLTLNFNQLSQNGKRMITLNAENGFM
jgi:hypothetical protein